MIIRCSHSRVVKISELNLNPDNRNVHPEDQIKRLADILKYQGWRYCVKVSNQTGIVTSGHGRVEAALLNGWSEVPVDDQDYDTPEQEYADTIADNAIASWAELNLGGINSDIQLHGPELNIDMLGMRDFTIEPIDKLDPQCDEDEVPEHVEPQTKLGDIYQLGRHRLLCGDSTSIDAVEKLMDGEKADMVFTDPPYGISLGFETKEQAKARNRRTDGLKIKNDNLSGNDLEQFLVDALSNMDLVLKVGGAFYICSPIDAEVKKFISAIEKVEWHYQSGLVWNKSSLSLSRHDYHPKHEIIHYGWKSGAAHIWVTDRKQTTVFDFDKPSRSEHHPTTKPIGLIEYYISNVSKSENLIIDLFGGSGSTLIACEKTNRKCFMMELDPHYCDVIVARWEKYTGKKAERITDAS